MERGQKQLKRVDPVAAALLNSCKLLEVNNGALTINFSSELLYEKMNNEKTLRTVKKELSAYFGQPIEVISTAGQNAGRSPQGYEPGGLVDLAQKELGGRVRKVEKKKE